MAKRSHGWNVNRTLALVAVALGALAVFGSPEGGSRVTIDTRELASIVESEVDHVTPETLADWIIEGRVDYRLIDLRDDESVAAYHIPTAEPVPIGQLSDYPLFRNEKIVLYSDAGTHSAQAWFLLKASGYPGVYMLLGGLDAWKEDVLFPSLPVDATLQQTRDFERARFVSDFFGGSPRSGVTDDATQVVEMPKVEMPSKTIVVKQKKRKKKGC